MTRSCPVLTVDSFTKTFGSVSALNSVSLSAQKGETITIIGRSGSGKSTLLRCIDLLEFPSAGRVEYFGNISVATENGEAVIRKNLQRGDLDVLACEVRQKIGFVSQDLALWEDRSVLHNLVLAPKVVRGVTNDAAEAEAEALCCRLGLQDKLRAMPWQLSGGQRQRVAIARALMMNPPIMLFDEITSALDPILTYDIMQLIRELKAAGVTILIVTHHIQFGISVSDRIIFMEDGRVVQDATPEEFISQPANDRVYNYLNILKEIG